MSEMAPFGGGLARREARRMLAILGLTAALAAFVSACGGVGAVDPQDDEPIEMGSMQWLRDPVSIEVGVDVVQWPGGGRAA